MQKWNFQYSKADPHSLIPTLHPRTTFSVFFPTPTPTTNQGISAICAGNVAPPQPPADSAELIDAKPHPNKLLNFIGKIRLFSANYFYAIKVSQRVGKKQSN